MATVLKNFPYSPNGWDIVHLKTGDEYEDFGEATQGLVDEDYIEAEGFTKSKKKK
jgi:hypothetical protein